MLTERAEKCLAGSSPAPSAWAPMVKRKSYLASNETFRVRLLVGALSNVMCGVWIAPGTSRLVPSSSGQDNSLTWRRSVVRVHPGLLLGVLSSECAGSRTRPREGRRPGSIPGEDIPLALAPCTHWLHLVLPKLHLAFTQRAEGDVTGGIVFQLQRRQPGQVRGACQVTHPFIGDSATVE